MALVKISFGVLSILLLCPILIKVPAILRLTQYFRKRNRPLFYFFLSLVAEVES
jgi:hypothetical protein